MKCDQCGKTLLRNERICPYCGRVYGPSRAGKLILTGLAVIAILVVWMVLRA